MRTFSSVPVAFAFLATLVLAGCSSSTNPPEGVGPATNPTMAKSALARDTSPTVADSDKTALADGMSAFAFDLFGQIEKLSAVQNKNFACSPASVSLALGMTYAGAAGNTATQFKSVLHVTQTPATFFSSLDSLSLALATRADEALSVAKQASSVVGGPAAPNPDDFRLHIVNSIWGEKTLTFEQPFLDTLATDFGAGVYLADFINQPDAERLKINAWVSQETANKINDLLPSGSIDSFTRVALVNALHLKLPWETPFPASTATSPFKLDSGTTANAYMMQRIVDSVPYVEDIQAQAVAVPLQGQAVYFVVFLPKPGTTLAQFEAESLATEVQTLTTTMFTARTNVSVTLPRFNFTIDSLSIKAPLEALGLVDAFDPAADFSGITSPSQLALSDVFHKAMVAVDESGVEAAAATAAVMGTTGLPEYSALVYADHPFFFGIYDKPTATWLFLGHVVDPTQG